MPHSESRPYDTGPNAELSLPKHSRISSPSRRSRQKACNACSASKTRCDLTKPICSRCLKRGDQCEYAPSTASAPIDPFVSSTSLTLPTPASSGTILNDGAWAVDPVEFTLPSPSSLGGSRPEDRSSFQSPGDASISTSGPPAGETPVGRIALRWLAVLAPDDSSRPPARSKHLSTSTVYFCSRFLRAFPLQLADASPSSSSSVFVHPSHLQPAPPGPLANAITLIKMFRAHAPGSEGLVVQTVMTELANIMSSYQSFDPLTCLAAFQSYLLLTLLAYFHFPEPHRQAVVTIETFLSMQALADRSAHLIPLIRRCDRLRRPTIAQSDWILSESLRRSIVVACVFDDMWNAIAGIPTFVAEELAQLPAVGPEALWNADPTRWESIWEDHRALWNTARLHSGAGDNAGAAETEPGLRVGELWGKGDMSEALRDARIDQWLVGAGALSLWTFAICEMAGTGRGASMTIM